MEDSTTQREQSRTRVSQFQPSILAAVRAHLIATALLTNVLVIMAASGAALAQPAGTLAGSLFDQTGGALVNVALDVRGPVVRDRQSDATGRFEFRDLPPGDYEFTAALAGFESIRRAIRIESGTSISLSMTMIVASLEQTVVTAAKTGTTDVQSSPLAISAISSTALSRFATRTIDEAAAQAPSVTFTQSTTFGQLSIRGIGTNAVFAGADPSSAMYLDGVYLARPAMAFTDFLDVERIEVLRGPQGTLYGRNALGGAVNLITKAPSNDFEASARVTIGNLAERRAEARLTGALKRDRVMGSLAFIRGVRDGYVRDLNHPDQPLGGDNFTSARGQLRVVLSPRSDVVLSADASDQAGRILSNHKILSIKPGFTVDNPAEPRDVRLSTVNSSGVRHSGAMARVTSQLTPATTLISITGFRRLNNQYVSDADVSELDLLVSRIHEWQHQWSEELTVSGHHRNVTWVGGLFVFDEFDHQGVWVDQNASRTQVQLDPRVNARSRAVFGETTIQLTPRLSGTVGLRYSREQKDIENTGGLYSLNAPMPPVAGSTYAYNDSIMHTAWTPRFAVAMKLPHEAMTYSLGDARIQERWVQSVVDATRSWLRPRMGMELRSRREGAFDEGACPHQRGRVSDGLHESSGAGTDWYRCVRHQQCCRGDDSGSGGRTKQPHWRRPRSGRAPGLVGRNLRSLHRGRHRRRHRRRRWQAVEQCAGVVRPSVARMDRQRWPLDTLDADRGRNGAVHRFLHTLQ